MKRFAEKSHILIVDDDDRLRALLQKFLSEQGMMVSIAAGAKEARRLIECFAFDAAVFDVMMPEETGLELLASLGKNPPMPVLMLSAMGEAEHRIRGLETGAEDYLAKPFEPKELVLRLKSLLRRASAEKEARSTISFGEFTFDATRGELTHGGETVALTSGEAQLLKLLAAEAGKPVTREALAKNMRAASERSIDVQINRLRKKIEKNAGRPQHLKTIRGAGYVLYVS